MKKKKNYNELIKKLKKLYCHNSTLNGDDLPDDGMVKSCLKLRADIVNIIESEYKEFVQWLALSGIIEIVYGDMGNDSCVVMEAKSLNISNENFLVIEAGNIHTSSTNMPQDMIDWFSDRYAMLPLNREENSKIQ